MADIAFAHKVMFFIMATFNTLALVYAFKAKRMITGYRAKFLTAFIGSFLVFSVALILHFYREFVLAAPIIIRLEHSFVLLSFVFLLFTGLWAMRNRQEWGIP